MSLTPRSRGRRTLAGLAATALTLTVAGTAATAQAQPAAEPGPLMNYVVNATNDGATSDVEAAIKAVGGTVVQSWPQIGVVVAQSTDADFKAEVRNTAPARTIQSVGATRTAAVSEGPAEASTQSIEAETAVVPDPRESEQWDMQEIKANLAHEITDGSRSVLVGINDSGIDETHPDLAPNFDAANSVNCIDNGVPNTTPGAWRPTTSDHGQHVAGTVAAARNGVGIVGVAPNVRIASVKVVNDDGFIYPEYSICGFIWAAEHGMAVTNHSYFIDPWLFWCDDDADQGAVQTSVRRAVAYATGKGSLAVAAAGNSNYDLANKTTDSTSPNDTTPAPRTINNDCLDMPTELPGVITVSSLDRGGAKSSFSNFGLEVIDVAAPGRAILSTVLGGRYGLKSGTSMASPHVAGVAALVKSAHPTYTPAMVTQALHSQADDHACPTTDARCVGTTDDNAFYGEGITDALDAVTR
jgi:subtilisin family serine protease